jgi:hypothetical protein
MINTYVAKDCGGAGKTTEKAFKEALGLKVCVSRPGRTDMRKAHTCYEIKTGAGELGDAGGKLLKGCTKVIYVPVVDCEKAVEQQEGFVMSREVFLEVLEQCGLIREKTSTKGVRKVTIQTFWNVSRGKPNGRGYARMLEAFYSREGTEVQTLQDWFAQFGV